MYTTFFFTPPCCSQRLKKQHKLLCKADVCVLVVTVIDFIYAASSYATCALILMCINLSKDYIYINIKLDLIMLKHHVKAT